MITKLTYDWQPSNIKDGVPQYRIAEVGKEVYNSWDVVFSRVDVGEFVPAVEVINEHPAKGEGDKWYYDITFSDGTVMRTFNPCTVFYAKEEKVVNDDLPF